MSYAHRMGLKKALIIPDTHAPYQHKKAYELMIKVAKDLKPDEIVLLGDFADFYSVSRYAKDPRLSVMLIEEIEEVNRLLDQLDKLFPRAKKVYIEGNHEKRLETYLCDKCPALFGFVDCKELFKIHQRAGWKWCRYAPSQKHRILNSKLYAKHEPLASMAKATASRALCSITYGHIHKAEEAHVVGLNGEIYTAFSVGWLGDKRKDSIFDYVKGTHQWTLGFGVVYVDEKTGNFYHKIVHINENISCEFNGKLYK